MKINETELLHLKTRVRKLEKCTSQLCVRIGSELARVEMHRKVRRCIGVVLEVVVVYLHMACLIWVVRKQEWHIRRNKQRSAERRKTTR